MWAVTIALTALWLIAGATLHAPAAFQVLTLLLIFAAIFTLLGQEPVINEEKQ
ncbi:hypothetical protein ACFO4L_09865 [Bacillus daqingensis]|uniref:Uncharacterized protein n=1 Tax=Bacillus daqingensis TaxID=872396 RepID=A0ABV9NXV2_9BACI